MSCSIMDITVRYWCWNTLQYIFLEHSNQSFQSLATENFRLNVWKCYRVFQHHWVTVICGTEQRIYALWYQITIGHPYLMFITLIQTFYFGFRSVQVTWSKMVGTIGTYRRRAWLGCYGHGPWRLGNHCPSVRSLAGDRICPVDGQMRLCCHRNLDYPSACSSCCSYSPGIQCRPSWKIWGSNYLPCYYTRQQTLD